MSFQVMTTIPTIKGKNKDESSFISLDHIIKKDEAINFCLCIFSGSISLHLGYIFSLRQDSDRNPGTLNRSKAPPCCFLTFISGVVVLLFAVQHLESCLPDHKSGRPRNQTQFEVMLNIVAKASYDLEVLCLAICQ